MDLPGSRTVEQELAARGAPADGRRHPEGEAVPVRVDARTPGALIPVTGDGGELGRPGNGQDPVVEAAVDQQVVGR
jgi:hypothetical protein